MAASSVDICNMALAAIGETQFIQSLTEGSTEADVCNLFYDKCRREVLESADWLFATKQTAIAEPSGVSRTGWDHVYTLPADCARPIALLADGERVGTFVSGERHAFDIQLDDDEDGRLLCTDLDIDNDDFEVLEYVAYVTYVPMMPELFVDALLWLLGSWLALSIQKDPKKAGALRGQYDTALSKAAAVQFQGTQDDPEPDSPGMASRS